MTAPRLAPSSRSCQVENLGVGCFAGEELHDVCTGRDLGKAGGHVVENTLKFPVGKIPELSPNNLPPQVIEAWRTELRLDLHRRGLLKKILSDPNRKPRGPRFRLID
jgi:hypothetical protein